MSSKKYNSLDRGSAEAQDIAVSTKSAIPAIRIDALVAGGRGIGRIEGRVWLVEGAVPGDLVRAEAVRVRKGHVEARVVEVLESSSERRSPPCPIQGTCGGCPWMVLDEAVQRASKRRLVSEALERVGRLRGVDIAETVASDRDLGYRNKVELAFGRDGGRLVLGFHPSGSGDRIVDVERCLLQGSGGSRFLASAREFFLEGPGRSEPALLRPGDPLRLVVRESRASGKVLVALRGGPGPVASAVPFATHLMSRYPEVTGVVRIISLRGRRGGARTEVLLGEPWIEETLGGTRFRLPAAAFFQVNTGAAERLLRLVLEASGPTLPPEILDLYGGVGVFGITLAHQGARATVVEADRQAVDCGKQAAAEQGLEDVAFVVSRVAPYLRDSAPSRPRPDLVIADPPRTGLERGVADAIARLAPARIVLVSCDPATLGRDLRALTDHGYSTRRVIPVDLFPQTANVEAVALLEPAG